MAKKKNKSKPVRNRTCVRQPQLESANGEVMVHHMPGTLSRPAKVCRLCEAREGPFLNIFSSEKNTAKKIYEVMPFSVTENDELPQQICFRCSAKVEELHEFIQKCIKAQNNLYSLLGKKCHIPSLKIKTHRSMWEATLTKSNKSNDDICDAVIKKAMEGIKDTTLPLAETKLDIRLIREKKSACMSSLQKQTETEATNDRGKKAGVKPKQSKPIRNNEGGLEEYYFYHKSDAPNKNKKPTSKTLRLRDINSSASVEPEVLPKKMTRAKANLNKSTYAFSQDLNTETEKLNKNPEFTESDLNRFSIMDHVIMIKVNGVGVLFQCKLCNRNFLKKEVVLSHWCAKNGTAKEEFTKKVATPVVPKAPTVKYINTKTDSNVTSSHSYINTLTDTQSKQELEEDTKPVCSLTKPKPKIGPASKVKKNSNEPVPTSGKKVTSRELTSPPVKNLASPVVQCATAPSLNCRYKLVPGPNHTFTLVEILQNEQNDVANKKNEALTKRKLIYEKWSVSADGHGDATRPSKVYRGSNAIKTENNPEIINLDESSVTDDSSMRQPYPVGLFKSVKANSPAHEPSTSSLIPFITSAQKKQSYTVVQTGNPSKLLITAKPQHRVQEFPKKQQKRVVHNELKTNHKQPISIALQNADPSDNGEFFNFMNLDPLLHPSYVLPEPQTSPVQKTTKNSSKLKSLYTCNMCRRKFTKEQKLLAHIHAHYEKLDKKDIMRLEKVTKISRKK